MIESEHPLIVGLKSQAVLLNSISRPDWFARPFYEYMSGGLVWSDETRVSHDTINVLRPLWNHRSMVILGKDDERWAEYWRIANELFPKWIGFRASRCTSTPALRKMIRAGHLRMYRECRQLEAEMERDRDG